MLLGFGEMEELLKGMVLVRVLWLKEVMLVMRLEGMSLNILY